MHHCFRLKNVLHRFFGAERSPGVGNLDPGGPVSLQSLAPTLIKHISGAANQGLQDAVRYSFSLAVSEIIPYTLIHYSLH